ncbi:hypothetical protein GYA49_06330 [Candidatus Beckwithbacteria bacterium]|nr:hypothetical protein [Candidatus Beckwithbacteria bacterium]
MNAIFSSAKHSRLIYVLFLVFVFLIGGLVYLSWSFVAQNTIKFLSPVNPSELKPQIRNMSDNSSRFNQNQIVGQVLMTTLEGTQLSASEAAWLRDGVVGGILLLGRNIENKDQLKALTTQIMLEASSSGVQPFIAVDQEGGSVARIDWIEKTAQVDITSTDQAYQVALKRGQALKDLGITMNLAPVLECSSDQESYIASQGRSFSNHCLEKAMAMVKGYRVAGIIPVVKHFPDGLAWTTTDPHKSLPIIDQDQNQLLSNLQPYRQLIKANIPALMVTHLNYPLLDSRPASASYFFLTSLLAENFSFTGLIIVDDLSMKAVADNYEVGEYALNSLNAGADFLIASSPNDFEKISKTLFTAWQQKQITKSDFDRKLLHITAVKQSLNEH